MSKAKTSNTKRACFVPGYWVAVCLHPGAAPIRVYVGQIQAVDERGVRLTLIDWLVGQACGDDFFAPWSSIASSLMATPEHDLGLFLKAAGKFQTAMTT